MSARGARMLAFAVVVAALAYYALAQVRVSADFSAFLPAGADARQRAVVTQLREGSAGRLLLVALSDAEPARLAAASRALVQALSARDEFRYAANGDVARAEGDLDFILAHRYVLSPDVDAARFTIEGLRASLAQRLEGLYGSAAPLEKRTLAQDPTGEALATLRALRPAQAPRSVDGVWFDAEGRRALLVAQTRAVASDLDGQAAALHALRSLHADVAPGTAIAWTSPGALAVESRAVIAHEARVLSIASAALVVGVLAFTYRAPLPILLCAVPAATGLLAAVVAVHAVLGHLNGITLAFGATLLGEAVDYPSFLFTQLAPAETAQAARRRIGPLLRLAVLTTACGALALLLSGFSGLIELGVLTVVGIVVAGAVTWWIVPDWAPATLSRALPGLRRIPRVALPFAKVTRIGAVIALLAGVAVADLHRTVFDDDLAHLNPLPREAAARDRDLRAALGAPDVRALVIVRGANDEDVLERSERLRPALADAVAAREVEGFDLVSDYLPSARTQEARRAALPSAAVLESNLQAARAGLPFRADAFVPFMRDVERARDAPLLRAQDLAGTALGAREAALLGRDGDGPYAVVPLRGLRDAQALAARVAALGDPQVAWFDLRADAAALLGEYRRQVLLYSALGVAVIGAVIAVALRSPRRALAVLGPIVAAALLAAGLLVATGTPLTLFHLVALLLVVGIGVNYALFAERAARGADEPARTVRTLLVVSATTLCAFATLAASSIPVLRALGLTVCAGVILSLAIVALTSLPRRASA